MNEQITSVFNQALTKTNEAFICEKIPTFREYRGALSAQRYAEFDHSETYGNQKKNYYNIRELLATTLDVQQDFSKFLTRDFALALGEIFRTEGKDDKLNYIISLLKNIVSDNEIAPLSIKDIRIDVLPKQIYSEEFVRGHKKESELYMHPTGPFTLPYDNCWNTRFSFLRTKSVYLNGTTYRLCEKQLFNLDEILKDQNVTPVLQMLMKLWILHQLAISFDKNELSKHSFFMVDNIEEVIVSIQENILDNISKQIRLSFQERNNIAKVARENNRFALSPVKYFLAQRLSFVKLIAGFSKEDIHSVKDQQLSWKARSLFYLSTYLNYPLIKYIVDIIKKDFAKTKSNISQFVAAKSLFPKVLIHSLKLTRSTLLALWLPFLSAYFMLVGITSLPISLAKKTLNISQGNIVDKILTFLEAMKDIALGLYLGAMALELLAFIETLTVGSFILSVGASVGFYATWLCVLPLTLLIVSENWKYTYPGWFQDEYGKVTYIEKSPYTRITEGISYITSNRLLSFHAFFAGVIVVGYSTIALGALVVNKAYNRLFAQKNNNKVDVDTLRQIGKNLNHSPKFIQLSVQLAQKLEAGTCDANDNTILAALSKCHFSEESRALLKAHLQRCVQDPNILAKNVYRLGLLHVDSPTYIPSWKLIQQVEKDLEAKQASLLKAQVHDLHNLYQRELKVAI